jgi:hypothetical protein
MTTLDSAAGAADHGADRGAVLAEAMRELEAAIHDARVAYDCIGLGELDRAHTSAVTARVAIDAAMTAVRATMDQVGGPALAAKLAPENRL